MNANTETRPQPASPETSGSTNTARGAKPTTAIDPKRQSRRTADGRQRRLWVALAALASCAGVAAAVAIGASDGSSSADVDPIVSPKVDVPRDRDVHREPVGPSADAAERRATSVEAGASDAGFRAALAADAARYVDFQLDRAVEAGASDAGFRAALAADAARYVDFQLDRAVEAGASDAGFRAALAADAARYVDFQLDRAVEASR